MKDDKLKVGDTVWVIGQNNGKDMTPIETKVTKVGTKLFRVAAIDKQFEIATGIDPHNQYGNSWGSRICFHLGEYNDQKDVKALTDKIRGYFGHNSPRLSSSKLRDIVAIIESQ